ncbi:MAG: D-aminoacyl-tRNA deacylase [Candidatus Micrarchaeota archaeon]|nr:D-aminoacyl-tRNA deacylase [Candidatus Micrarchaeota archaeon]
MPTLFYSTQDPAAVHAAAALLADGGFESAEMLGHPVWRFSGFDLVELTEPALFFQKADDFKTDLAVFLSRHAGASGRPCFTCHLTGNFGPGLHNGSMGGAPDTLSKASAHWLKRFYRALSETTGRASMEATHHGPTLTTPTLFVETGSDESEWKKPENGRLLADAVKAALRRNDGGKVALGVGGTHYCSAFTPLLEQGWAFSHVASKYSVSFLTKRLLAQCLEKTVEPVDAVFLDKALSAAKKREVTDWCGELGVACEPA